MSTVKKDIVLLNLFVCLLECEISYDITSASWWWDKLWMSSAVGLYRVHHVVIMVCTAASSEQ